MKTELTLVERMILTDEEMRSFEIVDRVLREVQDDKGDKAILISQLTGECVETEELARVRGVLGFFTEECQVYGIKIK